MARTFATDLDEVDVVLGENPLMRGVGAQNAEWLGLSLDDHADAANDVVISQKRWSLKALFDSQVSDDHRMSRSQGIAGLRVPSRFDEGVSDQTFVPPNPSPQEQIGLFREQLEDFHELDVKGLRNPVDGVVEQVGERNPGQGFLSNRGNDFLLPLARREETHRVLALGNVLQDRHGTGDLAGFVSDGPPRRENCAPRSTPLPHEDLDIVGCFPTPNRTGKREFIRRKGGSVRGQKSIPLTRTERAIRRTFSKYGVSHAVADCDFASDITDEHTGGNQVDKRA